MENLKRVLSIYETHTAKLERQVAVELKVSTERCFVLFYAKDNTDFY